VDASAKFAWLLHVYGQLGLYWIIVLVEQLIRDRQIKDNKQIVAVVRNGLIALLRNNHDRFSASSLP
jgi:hypothetical protein